MNVPSLLDVAKHLPLPFYNATAGNILINRHGLVANNINNGEGRGNYFPGVAGTTEGMLLLVKGVADAFNVTGDTDWEPLLDKLIDGLDLLYGNEPVAHWLFAVKGSFVSERLHYDRLFNFVDGVAVISEAMGGGLTKNFYHARSNDSVYLWQNPYSSLVSGQFYPIASVAQNPNKTTTVILTNASFTGEAFIMYSTLEGDTIQKDQLFEAWPCWRKLEAGEINIAMDSVAWALDAYKSIMRAKNDVATYQPKIDQIAASVLAMYNVNDGRAWIARRLVDPLQVDGSFVYTEVSGLSVTQDVDGSILFSMPTIPAPGGAVTATGLPAWYDASLGVSEPPLVETNWNSEVQYGRALSGVILPADSIYISVTASRAITVGFFIDTANIFSPATRFFFQAALAIGDNALTVDTNQFVNASLIPLAVGQDVFAVGWRVLNTHLSSVSPFELSIHDLRPIPEIPLNYMPGICPFTCNFIAGNQVSWRGPAYSGYQDPNIWDYVSGSAALADVVLDFLIAAQAHYASAFPGVTGPFAPVYYLNRFDSVDYGVPDTFGWAGPDPNTAWEGYQYRPLYETARYLNAHPTSTKALQIVESFLAFLNDHFDSALGFPSDYPGDGVPEHNYFSAHGLFMVLGAAVYFEQSGHGNTDSAEIMQKAAALAISSFNNGIWTIPGGDWFGFWNGVILSVLALIKDLDLTLFSASQLDAFFRNNLAWLIEHTE